MDLYSVEGVELPSYYCVQPVFLDSGASKAVDTYFSKLGIPKLGESSWGWPNGQCAYGSHKHRRLAVSVIALLEAPALRSSLDALLVTDGSPRVRDELAYFLDH